MLGSGKTTSAVGLALLAKRRARELAREVAHPEHAAGGKQRSLLARKTRARRKWRKRGQAEDAGAVAASAPLLFFCCPVAGVVDEFANALENAEVQRFGREIAHLYCMSVISESREYVRSYLAPRWVCVRCVCRCVLSFWVWTRTPSTGARCALCVWVAWSPTRPAAS